MTPLALLRCLLRRGAVAAALATPLAALRADVVTLDDGRVIEGEIVSAAGAPVLEIKTASAGLVAVQRFEVAHVVKIERGPSPRQQALAAIASQRAALGQQADGGEADAWVALARKAREVGDTALAKDLATEALARDRQHAEAHRLLGEAKQNGVWMRPREAATARGEVYFRGRWVAWLDKEATLAADERARREAEVARRKLAEQRAADAAAAAVEEPPVFTYGTYQAQPRVVYWAPASWGGCSTYGQWQQACNGGGVVIHANGHAGSTGWSVDWHW